MYCKVKYDAYFYNVKSIEAVACREISRFMFFIC